MKSKHMCGINGCVYETISAYHLKRHQSHIHDLNVEWFPCSQCEKKFKTNSDLKQHMSNIHDLDVKWYNCEHCKHKCKKKSNLNKHMSFAHNINVHWYQCEHCEMKFKGSGNLKKHMSYLHDIDVTWHHCEHCEMKFKTNGGLKKHMSYLHDIDVTWHHCEHCEMKFKTNSELKKHMSYLHDIDVTWHNCEHCEMKFKTNSGLKSHMSYLHDIDVTWHNCEQCEMKFKTNSHFKRHTRQVHDTGTNKCDCCLELHHAQNEYVDSDSQMHMKLCKSCYQERTGCKSRIEHDYVDYLREHIKFPMYHDQTLRSIGACPQRNYRPDLLFAGHNLIIQIELDEHQHMYDNGDYSCDEKRISDIHEDIGTTPLIVIRINPHKVKSSTVVCKHTDSTAVRCAKLVDLFDQLAVSPPKELIRVFYMYYDHDNERICRNLPITLV